MHVSAIDDPNRVVRTVASDGKTGEQREIAYTGCRVVGNGSFGVVYQVRLSLSLSVLP
jgi:glycogen synthase kinase 3 beta